jgi:hypothetical protein
MKKFTLKAAVIAILCLFATNAKAQFNFTVSPGLSLNGATFGYKIGKIVPELGINYLLTRGTYVYKGKKYDNDQGEVVDDNYSYNVTLGYILPRIGLRVYLAEKEDLKMFVSAGFVKPIIFGNSKEDGMDDFQVSDEIDKVSLWGTDLSFGMEYFLSDRFSFSGQFGLRYFGFRYNNKYDSSVYNPNTGNNESYEAREQFKLSLNPTFSRIGLNFYF